MKKLIYVFAMAFLVMSCENDATKANEELAGEITEIKVGFADDNTSASVTEGETASYRIGMPKAVDGDVKITLEVTSSDGDVEATYENTVMLNKGQSEVIYEFTPTDDGKAESGETYTIKINEIEVENANGINDKYIMSSDRVRILSVKDKPIPLVTTAGDLKINFTWSGSSDLDCRILDNPPTAVYDTGYSTSPGESVVLDSSVADGSYILTVRPWVVNDASIDYMIEVNAPTETRTYNGTFTDLAGGWTMEFIVLEISKTTNGSEVTYLITQY